MKKLRYVLVIFIMVLIVVFMLNNSYALNEEELDDLDIIIDNTKLDITLEFVESELEFNNSIYSFIDLIDDSLIPTATFNMSNKLSDNYDFLTIFAIDFILNNEEYYKDDIVIRNDYIYDDGYNSYVTNKYISIDVIYDITYNILGKNNYYIVNEYLELEDNLIPLLLVKDYQFYMELEEILDIRKISNNYEVLVKYKDIDLIYKYVFKIVDDRLVIDNLEIG